MSGGIPTILRAYDILTTEAGRAGTGGMIPGMIRGTDLITGAIPVMAILPDTGMDSGMATMEGAEVPTGKLSAGPSPDVAKCHR